MLPDWVSNPGPLSYESGALPIVLRGPAFKKGKTCIRREIPFYSQIHMVIENKSDYSITVYGITFTRINSTIFSFAELLGRGAPV